MSSITVNGCWQWPCMGSSVIQDSCQHTPVSFQPNEELPDSVCWTLHPSGTFSTGTAWEALQAKAPLVPWYKIIWCPKYVPRWSIIEWLALLGRLATKDRLYAWGGCVLRGTEQETHEHLVFSLSICRTDLGSLVAYKWDQQNWTWVDW